MQGPWTVCRIPRECPRSPGSVRDPQGMFSVPTACAVSPGHLSTAAPVSPSISSPHQGDSTAEPSVLCPPVLCPLFQPPGPLGCHVLLGGSSFTPGGLGQEVAAPREETVGQQELWYLRCHPALVTASQEDGDTQPGDPGVPEEGSWIRTAVGRKLGEITPIPKSGVGGTWAWGKDRGQEGCRDGSVTWAGTRVSTQPHQHEATAASDTETS